MTEIPSGTTASPAPEPEAVRAALDQLVRDPLFASTQRNKEFLRFVVEAALAGKGKRIKSYTIAVDVFKRPSSFDPALDPIVRIEASRLRAALAIYYNNPAVNAEIRIVLPRGCYVPEFSTFQRCAPTLSVVAGAHALDRATFQPKHAAPADTVPADGLSGRSLAAPHVAKLHVGQWAEPHPHGEVVGSDPVFKYFGIETPALIVDAVEPLAKDEPTRLLARIFAQSILTALGRYDSIVLFGPSALEKLAGFAGRSVYRLSTEVRIELGRVHVWWSLSDARTSQIHRSATESGPWSPTTGEMVEADIAARVAAAIADQRGLIQDVTLRSLNDAFAVGYPALAQAQRYLLTLNQRAFVQVRRALEQTVAAMPDCAEAWAYLAYIYSCETRQGPSFRSFNESIELGKSAAAKAIDLAPSSALANFALMGVTFQAGDNDGFESAARAAVQLGPDDPKLLITIGNRLWAIGQWDKGMAMIRKGIALLQAPGAAELALSMDAYRRRDYREAMAIARRLPGEVHTAEMVLAASHAQLGEGEAARPHIDRLLRLRPDFAHEMRSEFRNFRVVRPLTDHFAEGLAMAGLPVSDDVISRDARTMSV
jgi:adenylate cyclase